LPLLGISSLVAIAITGAAAGAAHHLGRPERIGQPVKERDLLFADRSDGAVVVAVPDGRTVEVFTGENGFLRGTLRGFARARRLDHLSASAPFRLTRWSDGRLTLDDPANARHVELLAFGPDNAGVFARLLEATP
ncbi:MAG: hypothetical protein JOZ05_06650, partial [Acetobacteraceae bacterium]|nr:hypothetical protein [Acetobacteraceae bacterium]